MGAIEELELRVRRFEIFSELIRESDERLERRKIEIKTGRNLAWSYLLLSIVWLIGGIAVLMWMNRYAQNSIAIPFLPYLLLALALISIPILYLLKTREKKKEPEYYPVLLNSFYKPLLSGFKEKDVKILAKLAEKTYSDSLIREALRTTHEGDPDEVAYSLYLAVLYMSGEEKFKEELINVSRGRGLPSLIARLALETENV